jgi:hypothetical protein
MDYRNKYSKESVVELPSQKAFGIMLGSHGKHGRHGKKSPCILP